MSDSVLEALARALQLDDAERAHLFDLARAANPTVSGRTPPVQQCVRPAGYALYAPLFESPEQPANADLVGQLLTRSTEFGTRWAAHNVRFHQTGTKELHHERKRQATCASAQSTTAAYDLVQSAVPD